MGASYILNLRHTKTSGHKGLAILTVMDRHISIERKNVNLLTVVALAATLIQETGSASEWQSLDAIRHTAQEFAGAQFTASGHDMKVEIEAEQLDERLRLPACPRPLEAFLPANTRLAARTIVGVSCPGKSGWSLYVPLLIRAYDEVVISRRSIAKGETLTAADLTLERRDLFALAGAPLTELSTAVGQTLRFPIAAGTVLQPTMLMAPKLVRRGDTVTILAENAALSVRASGVALADGAAGDRIRVKNTATKKVIQATVSAAGLVRIEL